MIPNDVKKLLEAAVTQLTFDDYQRLFSEPNHTFTFGSLDRSTKVVFEELVSAKVDMFKGCFPSFAAHHGAALHQYVGNWLMNGYLLGRRVAGTWKDSVSFTAAGADDESSASQLRRVVGELPESITEEGGAELDKFVWMFSAHIGTQEVFASAGPDDPAFVAVPPCLISGFCLAMAEYHVFNGGNA